MMTAEVGADLARLAHEHKWDELRDALVRMHPADVFNVKLLRSVHRYSKIGALDPGTRRFFVLALTSTKRIWRHRTHDVRFALESMRLSRH